MKIVAFLICLFLGHIFFVCSCSQVSYNYTPFKTGSEVAPPKACIDGKINGVDC